MAHALWDDRTADDIRREDRHADMAEAYDSRSVDELLDDAEETLKAIPCFVYEATGMASDELVSQFTAAHLAGDAQLLADTLTDMVTEYAVSTLYGKEGRFPGDHEWNAQFLDSAEKTVKTWKRLQRDEDAKRKESADKAEAAANAAAWEAAA